MNGGNGAGVNYFTGTATLADASATSTASTLVVTANLPGPAGNSISVSYTASGSSEGAWGGATLPRARNRLERTDVICYYLTCTTGRRFRRGSDRGHVGYGGRGQRGGHGHRRLAVPGRHEGPARSRRPGAATSWPASRGRCG